MTTALTEWRLACGGSSAYRDGTVTCPRDGTWIKYRWGPGLGSPHLKCPTCRAGIYTSPTAGPYAGWGFVILDYRAAGSDSGGTTPPPDSGSTPPPSDGGTAPPSDGGTSGGVNPPPYPDTILPGLRARLDWCFRNPNYTTGFAKIIQALGLWFTHADGTVYMLREAKIPPDWTLYQYGNYVISIASSPYVVEVGPINEFFGWEVLWKLHRRGAIEAAGPDDFKQRAYMAPETITPQPPETPPPSETPPEPPVDTEPAPPPSTGPGTPPPSAPPEYPPYQPPSYPPAYGPSEPTQAPAGYDRYILYGGIALAGLGVILLLTRRK